MITPLPNPTLRLGTASPAASGRCCYCWPTTTTTVRGIAAKICVSEKSVKNYCNRIGGELAQKGHQVLARYARRNRCLVREMYKYHTGKLPPP